MDEKGLVLYPHQSDGVTIMHHALTTNPHGAFMLCDEMGLGKTLQTHETIRRLGVKHVLVVCPAPCMDMWSGYVVKSYESLVVAHKTNDELIFDRDWDCFVMDEIHRVKNAETARCKAVAAIRAKYRIGLSGTPFVNRGSDLLTILRYGLQLKNVDWDLLHRNPNAYDCTRLIQQVTLVRKKTDVDSSILPVRNKELEEVELDWTDLHQKKVYVASKSTRYAGGFGEGGSVSARYAGGNGGESILSHIQHLRQLCLHPISHEPCFVNWSTATQSFFHPWLQRRANTLLGILPFPANVRNRIIRYVIKYEDMPILPSPKMMYVYDMCLEHRKLVVFCTYRAFLEEFMQPWLASVGIVSRIFCGGSKSAQKRALREFETDDAVRVLLVVKAAGGEGINLQKVCNVCIVMDSHFSSAADEQAIQRIDRIGQKATHVTVRKLYMKNSIDIALRELQKSKELEAERWIGNDFTKKRRRIDSDLMCIKKYDTV
jgi:SNF2 family DNA or RNA helicase